MAKQRRKGGRTTQPKGQRRVLIVEDAISPLRAQVRATLAADHLTELETRRRELVALDAAMAEAGAVGIDVPAMAERELRARHHPETGQTVLEVVQAGAEAMRADHGRQPDPEEVAAWAEAEWDRLGGPEAVAREERLALLDRQMAVVGSTAAPMGGPGDLTVTVSEPADGPGSRPWRDAVEAFLRDDRGPGGAGSALRA